MSPILPELFSTIGMILLAGEFIQGRQQWFTKALERFIVKLFPKWLFFRDTNQWFVIN
jgi:hypothetical protein